MEIRISNLQIQHIMSEVENLCEDDKRSASRKAMDDEMVMNLFNNFTGGVKAESQVDCRKEMNEYLDERYGA